MLVEVQCSIDECFRVTDSNFKTSVWYGIVEFLSHSTQYRSFRRRG